MVEENIWSLPVEEFEKRIKKKIDEIPTNEFLNILEKNGIKIRNLKEGEKDMNIFNMPLEKAEQEIDKMINNTPKEKAIKGLMEAGFKVKSIREERPYRTFITLTNEQANKLHKYCDETGNSISSLFRALLDDFLRTREKFFDKGE